MAEMLELLLLLGLLGDGAFDLVEAVDLPAEQGWVGGSFLGTKHILYSNRETCNNFQLVQLNVGG